MLAFALAHLLALAGEPAYLSSCPAESGRRTQQAVFNPPDNVHPTNRRVRMFLDIGSDGRVRRVAVVESSGDPTLDGLAVDAAKTEKFAAPSQNCITASTVVPESFNVPLISLVTPPPAGVTGNASIPTSAPAASLAVCPAPFVQLDGIDVPPKREGPGTVAIDVGLSANAKVTSVQLASSSGKKTLDDLATASARSAQYAFMLPPGCAPKPTTYRLELTYR
jgi:TonB family protein